MPRSSSRSRGRSSSDRGVIELARERPVAAAAVAASAAAPGLFLWSKRLQISGQLSKLSEQIGEWAQHMAGDDDSGGLATTRRTGARSRFSPGTRQSKMKNDATAGGRGRAQSPASTGQ